MDKKSKQSKSKKGCGFAMCLSGNAADVTIMPEGMTSTHLPLDVGAADPGQVRLPPSGKSQSRSQSHLLPAGSNNYDSRYLPMGGAGARRRTSLATQGGIDNHSYLGSSENIRGGSSSIISATMSQQSYTEEQLWHSTPRGKSISSQSSLYLMKDTGSHKTSSGYADSCSSADSSLHVSHFSEGIGSLNGDENSSLGPSVLHEAGEYHVDRSEHSRYSRASSGRAQRMENYRTARYLQQKHYERVQQVYGNVQRSVYKQAAQQHPNSAYRHHQQQPDYRHQQHVYIDDQWDESTMTSSDESSMRSRTLAKRMKGMRSFISGSSVDCEDSCFEVMEVL